MSVECWLCLQARDVVACRLEGELSVVKDDRKKLLEEVR